MLPDERHQFILRQISVHRKARVTDLCASLRVSIDTVRRDLRELEAQGKVIKVHGGAVATDFHPPFQPREIYAREEKRQIARKALTLIKTGMTVLTGGGTVMLELARMIPRQLKGTFFTVSPLVALEVTQRSAMEVILLAGKLSRDTYICTGSSVIAQLAEIKADLCLMGTNGLSLKAGITDNNWEVAQVKKAMLRASASTAVLCLSEKLGSVQKIQVCKLGAVDYLVTEVNGGVKLKKYGGGVGRVM